MQTATISFDPFNRLSDEACHERIRVARAKLGKKVVILCHHISDIYFTIPTISVRSSLRLVNPENAPTSSRILLRIADALRSPMSAPARIASLVRRLLGAGQPR